MWADFFNGMPITLYRGDPEVGPVTECHQITAAQSGDGKWFLLEHHGWWDKQTRETHAKVPILQEPHETEASLLLAMEERFKTLAAQGWEYKFTTRFDEHGFYPVRIP